MAGTAGFEPTHDGIKNRCLTTWRRPKTRVCCRTYCQQNRICRFVCSISTGKIPLSQYFFEKTMVLIVSFVYIDTYKTGEKK